MPCRLRLSSSYVGGALDFFLQRYGIGSPFGFCFLVLLEYYDIADIQRLDCNFMYIKWI